MTLLANNWIVGDVESEICANLTQGFFQKPWFLAKFDLNSM